ncbi:MAG: alanine racemase [Gemmatimonadales bacterium]|nr:MAG: alanine racemase [Gemmatimonadales bacterium]
MNLSTRAPRERAWVEVNLANLVSNARTAVAAAQGARLLPMVKADAYGLGAPAVARALEELDPWGFGVATVDEGVELRAAGIERPIVVFTPASLEALPRYRKYRLTAVLDREAEIRAWDGPFHVEIDTGMGRAGIRWDDVAGLSAISNSALEGAFTHFHSADVSAVSVDVQWTRFMRALERMPVKPRLLHAANSAGIWRLREHLNLVRPGIFLYGGRPGGDLPAPAPVVALRARVVSTRVLPQGEAVSYGAEWRAPQPTAVATLGIGYADGVSRAVQGKAYVLMGGRICPVIGRVTMDMLMVDAGPPEMAPAPGEVATLIGSDGSREITVDRFAEWSGTISYEVLTRLGRRLPRIYGEFSIG